MYKTIYIPVDNSDHSNTAVDVGVHLAKTYRFEDRRQPRLCGQDA